MKKAVVAGTLIIAGGFGAAALWWPQPEADYKPALITEAQILAEKGVYCDNLSGTLREGCQRSSERLH